MSDRITRHEMKEDALVTWAFQAWDWVQNNVRIVLAVVGGIVLLIGGLAWYRSANARAEGEAGRILAEASTNYWQGSYARTIQLTDQVTMAPYPCSPAVEVPREAGDVPHHLPGQNPFLDDYAKKHNIPLEATRGGAETALPEFMKKFAGAR